MHRFLRAIAAEPWAIWEPKAQEILGYLEARLSGAALPEPTELETFEPDARIDSRERQKTKNRSGNIAVIRVHGAISNRAKRMDTMSMGGGTSAEDVENEIRAAVADESVKAIVLDVNSPGGSAAGTPELASAIRGLRGEKPIVSQVNALSASAAYWIASATDEVIATESSQIGSIGVIAVHEEISQMLEQEGVRETIISAGQYKAEGNPYEPLTEEAQAEMQRKVDAYYRMFVDAVAEGRGVDREKVESDFGQGRVMLAADARRAGMIDRIGTLRETLERYGAPGDHQRERTRAAARSVPFEAKRLNLERHKA